MNFIKKIENDFKNLKFSEKSIFLGLIFGLMFWITLDSILLGISLGIIMMVAFNEEEKKSKGKNKK